MSREWRDLLLAWTNAVIGDKEFIKCATAMGRGYSARMLVNDDVKTPD